MKRAAALVFTIFILASCSDKNNSDSAGEDLKPVDSITEQALPEAFSVSCEEGLYERATKIQLRIYQSTYDTLSREATSAKTKQLMTLAKQTDSDQLKGRAFYKGGIHLRKTNRTDSAYYFYDRAQQFFKKSGDSLHLAKALISKSNIQFNGADYYGAIQSGVGALDHLKEGETHYRMAALNLLAMASKNLKKYSDALMYYQRCVALNPDSKYIPLVNNNLALVHLLKKNYKEAIAIWERIKDKRIISQNARRLAKIEDNLGFAYVKTGQTARGMSLMQKAYKTQVDKNNTDGQVLSALHFARVLRKQKPSESFQWAQKALKLADNPKSRLRALLLMGQEEKADTKYYLSEYSRLRDSVSLARQQSKDQFAKIRYESQRKARQILSLQNTNTQKDLALQEEETRTLVYGLIAVFILVSGALLIVALVSRHKKNREVAIYKREQELSKDLHDGVANDVYSIMNTIENNPSRRKTDETLDQLDAVYQKTRNLSRELNAPSLLENFSESLLTLINNFQNDSVNILTRNYDESLFKDMNDNLKTDIYRVVQELLTNMQKHSRADLVVIEFSRSAGEFVIVYRDNGKGIAPSQKKSKNGLQNVENRIKNHKGRVTFDPKPHNGLSIRLSFSL